MVEKLGELLGRKLTPRERRFVDWISGWERETIHSFEQLIYEIHAAGLVRGLIGQSGGKMLEGRGWVPVQPGPQGGK
jgi:hypothetical protein